MANRKYLHIDKLEKVKNAMLADGWCELKPKNCFEVLRLQRNKQKIIIYQKLNAKEHLTVRDADFKIIKIYLKGGFL
jgi:hypothetical protein